MDLEDIFKKIVEDKYYQLNLDKPNEDKFSKIKFFEANAVGAIGEEFIKTVMSRFGSVKNDGTIHDEYDIQMENNDDRGYRMIQKNFNKEINKKLVSMNPGNQVNLKLTLNVNDMYDICYLDEEIKKIMEK